MNSLFLRHAPTHQPESIYFCRSQTTNFLEKSNMLMTVTKSAAGFLSFGIGNVFTICFLRIHLLTFNLSDVVQSERVKTEKSKFNHCRSPRHLWQGNVEKENWQVEKQNRLNNSWPVCSVVRPTRAQDTIAGGQKKKRRARRASSETSLHFLSCVCVCTWRWL